MRDNQLIAAIVGILRTGLADSAIQVVAPDADNAVVQQDFQPTTQGTPSGPAVFLHKIGDVPMGWPARTDALNEAQTSFDHTEMQWMQTSFQITAMAQQDPSDVNAMTASDLCNAARAIMQSDATRATLLDAGIGIYRPGELRNPYFLDEKGQYEAAPSFDFTLTHQQVIITSTPVVASIEVNVDRV